MIEIEWEAKVEIKKEEIIRKVIDEDLEIKETISQLLTEKVFLLARDFKINIVT